MTQLIRIAATQRNELIAAHNEINLLRAALQARQAATPDTLPTRAEIHLHAFDQARAAQGMARGFETIGNAHKAQQWTNIARDFERAAARLNR